MHVERTFTVGRPIATVFDYLSDFTHTNEWDPGTVETHRTAGDGGLGTTYSNTSEFMGRQVELTYETVTFERPTRLQFQGTQASATSMDSMTFTAVSDTSTSIHYRADFHFGFFVGLVAPLFIRGKLEKLADETIAQLERALSS